MVLHISNQKQSLSYHQGLVYLDDVEALHPTHPTHPPFVPLDKQLRLWPGPVFQHSNSQVPSTVRSKQPELLESARRLRVIGTKEDMTIMHKHMWSRRGQHAVYCSEDFWSNDGRETESFPTEIPVRLLQPQIQRPLVELTSNWLVVQYQWDLGILLGTVSSANCLLQKLLTTSTRVTTSSDSRLLTVQNFHCSLSRMLGVYPV